MLTEFETDLRAALHERAARVHASSALLATDYRPRSRRLRPRLAIGGGLVTSAGAAAMALSLTGGASNAFAGWTRQPTTPTRGQLAATDAYCAQNEAFPGVPVQLVDTRGPFTFEIRSDGSANDFCTMGPNFSNSSGWRSAPPVTPAPGRLFLWTDHTSTDSGQPYTFMIAQAASDVTGANLTLDDGSSVTPTIKNGWVVAWWPGTAHLASAQLTTASGAQTQTFPRYPCDVQNCNGGSHGQAPDGGPGGG
jgi:hypothetical protein